MLYENLIVIATNNGSHLVEQLIDSILKHRVNYQILIVDTKSGDGHYNRLQKIVAERPDILLTQTLERTFDTGAYVWTYLNYKAENYHFIHDSVTIKSPNFFQDISNFLKSYDVVPYMWFKEIGMRNYNMFDEWWNFYVSNGCLTEINYGFFGPMFSCKKSSLDSLQVDKLVLPLKKSHQNTFERIWAILFEQKNLRVFKWHEFERGLAIQDAYPHITKTFFERL